MEEELDKINATVFEMQIQMPPPLKIWMGVHYVYLQEVLRTGRFNTPIGYIIEPDMQYTQKWQVMHLKLSCLIDSDGRLACSRLL